MSDTLLSKKEIQALLDSMNSDNPAELTPMSNKKKIRLYDFKRPMNFSKDNLKSLQKVYEDFAVKLSSFLRTTLRSEVSMRVDHLDQVSYKEYIRSAENPSLYCIFNLGTLEGKAIIETSLNVAHAILEKTFGGVGPSTQRTVKLTEIEEAVMNKYMQRTLQELNEAWSEFVPLEPQFSQFESNPSFISIMKPSEMVLLTTISITINNIEGIMNICIPYYSLEPIMDRLNPSNQHTSYYSTRDYSEELDKNVKSMGISLEAKLGTTSLRFEDILSLKEGDTIKLDQKCEDSIDILIGKEVRFKGLPKESKGKLAITITDVLKEELEDE